MTEHNAKPIVAAIDGSPPAWEALETALYLAHMLNRPVEVLFVIQLIKAGYFAFIDRHLKEDHESYGQKVLAEAQERGRKAGVEVHTHLLESEQDPSGAILAFLEKAGPVKFLVLGSHGHGFVARHLIGSVTEKVIREVSYRGMPVPVLIVPASGGPGAGE
ncbi:MAG: universal stress protein [Thermodesulfobacteriota bacterium]